VIGVTGEPFVTKKGELSINCPGVDNMTLLAPCLWMLPEYENLKDP
jgi:lysyl-tRNA synthetase class II